MEVTKEIKDRLNIVEVVSSYVRLEKSGIHWKSPCPFHQERTPSFMVNEERAMWHCFGCNRGGDVFAFVMEIENLTFREALEVLASRAGVELPQYSGKEEKESKSQKERLSELLELATKFYEKQLWEGEGQKKVLPYLQERGLHDDSIKKFRLGYAPEGWRHALDFLISKGFTKEEVDLAGIALRKTKEVRGTETHYDRFRDRIMFPIDDTFGKIIGYSARVAPGGDESQAKYVNTPETPLYHKSNVLYGISHAKASIKTDDEAILVEGNMDVIALHQAGHTGAIAVSGTALTPLQLRILKRYSSRLKLFFDMDAAGQKAARKSTELALQNEFQTKIVTLKGGKDAADLAKENPGALHEALQQAKEAPAAFLDNLLGQHSPSTAEGKRAIVEDFGKLLLAMTHPVDREHWIGVLAKELQTDERTLRESLRRIITQTPVLEKDKPETLVKERKEYSSRGEALRAQYIRLLMAIPGSWVTEEALISKELKEFLASHPLFFFVVQAGQEDIMTVVEGSEIKQKVAEELFQLFQADDAKNQRPEELELQRKDWLLQIREELIREVEGKEKLRSLERALGAARKAGDKEAEQRLLEEFVTLSARLSRE